MTGYKDSVENFLKKAMIFPTVSIVKQHYKLHKCKVTFTKKWGLIELHSYMFMSITHIMFTSSLKYDRISVRISFSTGFLKITRKSIRFPIILWTLAVPCNQTVNSIYWLYWSIVVANRYFCSIEITVNISRTVTLSYL